MKILISGDFCPNNRVVKLVDRLDYKTIFNDFIDLNEKADYSLVNLECPIKIGDSKGIKKVGPVLFTNENAVEVLVKAGFKGVTLANNHIKDIGEKGVLDTVEVCSKYGLDVVGAGKNKTDASEILYKTIEGVKIGIYNVAENEFSIASEDSGGGNPHDPIEDYYAIREANKNCDFLVVVYHGGHESYSLPSPRMKKLFRFYIDSGASVVVCHHAHRYSGYEVYKGAPVFYGLGNFCFDWKGTHNTLWNEGYSVLLDFSKGKSIDFKIYAYKQGLEDCEGVRLLNEEEEEKFRSSINELNEIIKDDLRLVEAFNSFCKERRYGYLVNFEPYNNKISRMLFRRGILPSFLREKKVINYFRCDSHLDVVRNLLQEK
ncbi:CapA family protein [Myroides odoratimimus]|uniref:CapA family protein n=1 Tax=Myroides odoratimimus TaxID=76832 RepID=UPI002DBE12BE|nr:CapA family protein [Myroides odoratimimus]MEC4008538.1 CapA family protein [Myroides odoratimimus]